MGTNSKCNENSTKFLILSFPITHETKTWSMCTKIFPKRMKVYFMFKGYLYYKTITFQNVPFEAHADNFFIS